MAASSFNGLTSGFFPSSNHDRLYTADQLGNVISALVNDGVIQSSGGDSLPFAVAFNGSDSSGSSITIGKGIAWLNNTWTANTTVGSISVSDPNLVVVDASHNRHVQASSANASQDRWDAIVIEVNKTSSVRSNTFAIVEGVPGPNPSQPNAHEADSPSEGRYYHTIAYVYRKAGSGTTFTDKGADKLIYKIGQNGGTPWVMSVAGTAVPIDDILNSYSVAVRALIAELESQISQAASHQLIDGAVTTAKLAANAVTGPKIANSTIGAEKLSFTTIQPDSRNKVPASNASSALIALSDNLTLGTTHAGCTIYNGTSAARTVTLNSTANFAVGTEMEFVRFGTGALTINASGNTKFYVKGNTSALTSIAISEQYGTVVMKMITANNWLVVGDIG